MDAVLAPELFEALPGDVATDKMFEGPKNADTIMRWGFRLVGWLLMFLGLGWLFGPITTFITVIPFLGPLLAGLGSFIVWVFSFIVTLLVAILIIAMAYSVYHPLMSMICLAV